MSIDTLNKRASTSQFGIWDAIAPTPDGSLASSEDRSQCNWLFASASQTEFPTDSTTFRITVSPDSVLLRTPSTESTFRRSADSSDTLRRF